MVNSNRQDIKYMSRCLELAKLGRGTAAPNPMVGAVIVHDGRIIGEGYHHRCGEAHAEVNAVNAVSDQSLLKESTIYVNLEPCAHVGRTPACSTMIIQNKIPKVVIGCVDSFAKVSGKGIEMLKKAGVEVVVGVLEQESLDLNRRFFTFYQKKRPYIILKWAETQDGFIDYDRTSSNKHKAAWITNDLSRALVHKWRTEESAFWVGTQTVIKDNPQLNVRAWAGRSPLRITFDRKGVLDEDSHFLDDSQATLIFTEKKTKKNYRQTEFVEIDSRKDINLQILEELYHREVQSVVVEGGRQLLDSLISSNLWDEARVFVGDKYFKSGVKAPIFKAEPQKKIDLAETSLTFYRNPNAI